MKFKMMAVVCMLTFLCASCADSGTPANADTSETGAVEAGPMWAQMKQEREQHFTGLNLDGIGDSDDEIYVSTIQFGDYEDKATAVRIRLGTGEALAEIIPQYGSYALHTGRLFSDEKDAVILEITNAASNYGAADVFVLDVIPVGADVIPEIAIRLGTKDGALCVSSTEADVFTTDSVTIGTEVLDIDDESQQGLRIHYHVPNNSDETISIYWAGNNSNESNGWMKIAGQ